MITKKTYIPAKPRNKKLINSGGGSYSAAASNNNTTGGGLTSEQLEIINNLSSWWKVDEQGNLYSDKNVYSKLNISAFGKAEDEGGSGGGVNMLQTWAEFEPSKDNWAVKAGLLVPFYNDTKSRLTSLEGGAALSLSTVGTGNGIANITKLGTVLTVTKSNFAELDTNGKILSSQLPSYVDDVLEFATLANFPVTGESGKIYIAVDTNLTYRWSGTAYVVISSSLALGETAQTAYRGDRGKIAYDHSQTAHQAILNGMGFVKVSGTTISYDNNSYSLSSHNHSGVYEPVFSKNTAFNKNFGNTVGTVTQGNDSRLSDARTPLAHVHAISDITGLSTSISGKLDKAIFEDLFEKVEISTGNWAIKAKYNFFGVGNISAYGFDSSGGEGGESYNRLDTWASYDGTKAGWVLSALLGKELDTRVINLESGSALTVNTTGAGNAITSISKAGSVVTANKDLTFSLSGHLHSISSITNLENTLNNKLETSIFNTHNTDNVRHITGAERTKWDGVVTDFAGLQIGGRNLIRKIDILSLGSNVTEGSDEFGDYIRFNTVNSDSKRFTHVKYKENTQYAMTIMASIDTGASFYWKIIYTDGTNSGLYTYNFYSSTPETKSLVSAKGKTIDYITYSWSSGGFRRIYGLQLTEGNKPINGWIVAPEDVQASIDLVQTNLTTHDTNTANPHLVTKTQVGLSNVDNTSDLLKPISTAMQTALNLKANLASPTFTGNVTAPTFTGALSGNATTATTLQTARTIWGQSFDGTANVSGAMTDVGSIIATGTIDTSGKLLVGNKRTNNNFGVEINTNIHLSNWTTAFLYNDNTTTLGGILLGHRTIPILGTLATANLGVLPDGGNMGVGNVNPQYKLDVSGTGRFTGDVSLPSLAMTGALSGATTIAASTSVTVPKVIFAAAGWSMEQVGSELQMKHNNVLKMKFTSTGAIVATNEITAFG